MIDVGRGGCRHSLGNLERSFMIKPRVVVVLIRTCRLLSHRWMRMYSYSRLGLISLTGERWPLHLLAFDPGPREDGEERAEHQHQQDQTERGWIQGAPRGITGRIKHEVGWWWRRRRGKCVRMQGEGGSAEEKHCTCTEMTVDRQRSSAC
jgi:hypothetical protein